MKKYEKYKKIDLHWLSEIPKHWSTELLKNFAKYGTGNSISDEEKENYRDIHNAIPYISTSNINLNNNTINYLGGLYIKNTDKNFKIAPKNATLVCIEGGSGGKKKGIINQNVCFVNKLCYIKSFKHDDRFVYYSILSEVFNYNYCLNISGDRNGVSINKIKEFKFIIPPLEEQKQIANYLDWKINEIDKLIEIEKQKIKRINNYIISLHDKLILNNDENIKSWIIRNDIYEYKNDIVKIKKLKNILKKIEKDADENKEVIICSNSGKSVLKGERKIGLYSDDIKMYQNIDKGQLMIHGMDTWHGAICISEYDGRCTRVVHVCDTKEDKLYIYYYLRLLSFLKLYKPFSNGVRQNTSDFRSWGNLGQINIVLPQFNDQVRISNKLYTLISNSEKVIALIKKEIEQLYELKNSIISEVVTGKIDVRDVVIPKYEKLNINEVIKEDSFEKGIENDDE